MRDVIKPVWGAPTGKRPTTGSDLFRIQSPPAAAFQVGLEFFPFGPVIFFCQRGAGIEAGLAFPEGGGIGHIGGVAAGLAVGQGQQFEEVDDLQGGLAGVAGGAVDPAGRNSR